MSDFNKYTMRPLFDLTSMLAIEGIFRNGTKDPWTKSVFENYTDLFIYSDCSRYAEPIHQKTVLPVEETETFTLLKLLKHRDNDSLLPVEYRTDELIELNHEYLQSCFERFIGWCHSNNSTYTIWLSFHAQPWIRGNHKQRFKENFLFDVEMLKISNNIPQICHALRVSPYQLFYTFDLVLRYCHIGELVGTDQYYLAHPIREEQNLPIAIKASGQPPNIPIKFGHHLYSIADKLTTDEYACLLHELRHLVREYGIIDLKPKCIDKQVLQEIATRLCLPPRLKAWNKATGIISGIVCGAGAYPSLGPLSAILGCSVSLISSLWDGRLPGTVSNVKWLRWAVKWDIEEEGRDYD